MPHKPKEYAMNTLYIVTRIGLSCGLALSLAACMTTTPNYDAHFGESVRIVRAMQTLNPDASANLDPVTGVGGRAAVAAMDRYGASYVKPPTDSNAYTVGIGTGSVMTGQ